MDAIAVKQHFLNIGTPLSGCRLRLPADVDGDTAVNTPVDVLAIQRFFLGRTTGIANVGKYQFTPASRTYPLVGSNQTGQNYDVLIFGDVAPSFADRADSPSQDEAERWFDRGELLPDDQHMAINAKIKACAPPASLINAVFRLDEMHRRRA